MLLTGAAGFIGARVHAALQAAGHDVLAVDALLPAAHGPGAAAPPGCRHVDIRDAEALARCWPVSIWCVIRPRWSARASTLRTRRHTAATTTSPPRCCWPRCSPPGAASGAGVVDGGLWAGPLRLPAARAGGPPPRRYQDLDAGVFEHRCPLCGLGVRWRPVDEDAPLRPAVCMRPARPRRSITRLPGRSRRAAR
ncbi:NAD dependent epimerase/dehydratase family protein [Mycobacterium xenopi 4042]|uniref:NAD dependent epimerase/dehydratase family protein n=1 Tax=Mycobacterium xenopi 4042 TaxID=1299334 RepID=X8C9G5_MYCXE|nr:NAD dependent epimerase/dehydratase family protein [Mycobacterium xenopi 4042]